jgi:hypothetical protein
MSDVRAIADRLEIRALRGDQSRSRGSTLRKWLGA